MISGTFFRGRAVPRREADPLGGAIVQRGGEFFPAPADGIDVQSGDQGDEPIPAMPDLGRLDGGVPAALLLIEPTEQQGHLPVDLLVGMIPRVEAVGTLALMDIPLGHGLTLRKHAGGTRASLPGCVEFVLG